MTKLVRALLLGLFTLALFWPARSFEFLHWDDSDAIVENKVLQQPSFAQIVHEWSSIKGGLYVPFTYTVWDVAAMTIRPTSATTSLDIATHPATFHLLNVLFHAGAVIFMYLLLSETSGRVRASMVGAAFFAVHPLVVEPVAWASTMYTPLHAMLGLLALWKYVRWARMDASPSRAMRLGALTLATVAFMLAMLSKPFGVVVPVLAGLIHVGLMSGRVRDAAPVCVSWLLLALPVMIANQRGQHASEVKVPPVLSRMIVANDAVGFYLTKVVVPSRLIPDYGRTPQYVLDHQNALYLLLPVTLAACVVWIGWKWKVHWPWVSAAVFVAALGPGLGLVPFDYQLYSTVADRYVYLALLGPALAVTYALPRPLGIKSSAVCVAALVVMVVLCRLQLARWRDTDTLFNYTLSVNSDSLAAHRVLGFAGVLRGDFQSAEDHYRAALRVHPDDWLILYNYGNLMLTRQDRPDRAAELYLRAIGAGYRDARMHNNLGVAFARMGLTEDAQREFDQAIALDPNLIEARDSAARLRSGTGLLSPKP